MTDIDSKASPRTHVLYGQGTLKMEGARNVAFEVSYKLTLQLPSDSETTTMDTHICCGTVDEIVQINRNPIPDGTFELDAVSGCRISHLDGKWSVHPV